VYEAVLHPHDPARRRRHRRIVGDEDHGLLPLGDEPLEQLDDTS
jgi:hypothetical protein